MPIESKTEVEEIRQVVDSEGRAGRHPATDERLAVIEAAQSNWPGGYDDAFALDGAVQSLDAGTVPDGVTVVVQADPANANNVTVGLTATPAIVLQPGQSITYQPKDRSQIRVSGTNGETVNVTHEEAV